MLTPRHVWQRWLCRIFGGGALALGALSLFEFLAVVASDYRKSGLSFSNVFSWFTTLLLILVIGSGGWYFWKLGRRRPNALK